MIERFFYAENNTIGRDIFFDPTYSWSTIWQEESLAIGDVYFIEYNNLVRKRRDVWP